MTMLLKRTVSKAVPSEINLTVTDARVAEGQPKAYWVRGALGPLYISGVRVVESQFENEEGKMVDTFNVYPPSKDSENINEKTGKAYQDFYFRPTADARKEFNKVIIEAVRKHLNLPVYEPTTNWKYSVLGLSPTRPNSVYVNKLALVEGTPEEDIGYIAIATLDYAGIEISGVFLKQRRSYIQKWENGKPVLDDDGKPVMIENTTREYGPEDGENPLMYLDFPSQEPTPKAKAEAKAAGVRPKRYGYISPISKSVRVEMRDAYVNIVEKII